MPTIKIDDDYGFLDIEIGDKVHTIDCYTAMELYDTTFPKDADKPMTQFLVEFVRTVLDDPNLKVSARAASKIVDAISAEIEDEKKDEPGTNLPE